MIIFELGCNKCKSKYRFDNKDTRPEAQIYCPTCIEDEINKINHYNIGMSSDYNPIVNIYIDDKRYKLHITEEDVDKIMKYLM